MQRSGTDRDTDRLGTNSLNSRSIHENLQRQAGRSDA
jgi:hypothetical protein